MKIYPVNSDEKCQRKKGGRDADQHLHDNVHALVKFREQAFSNPSSILRERHRTHRKAPCWDLEGHREKKQDLPVGAGHLLNGPKEAITPSVWQPAFYILKTSEDWIKNAGLRFTKCHDRLLTKQNRELLEIECPYPFQLLKNLNLAKTASFTGSILGRPPAFKTRWIQRATEYGGGVFFFLISGCYC